jgi:hypothetical protein
MSTNTPFAESTVAPTHNEQSDLLHAQALSGFIGRKELVTKNERLYCFHAQASPADTIWPTKIPSATRILGCWIRGGLKTDKLFAVKHYEGA